MSLLSLSHQLILPYQTHQISQTTLFGTRSHFTHFPLLLANIKMFSRAALSVLAVAVVVSASPVALRPSHASSDLVARDFNCNVENVSCCEQIMTQHEAAKALGGLLVLPGDLIGNVGLSCSVGLRTSGHHCRELQTD